MIKFLRLCLLAFTLLYAAYLDMTIHRIPNRLTASVGGIGLLVSVFSGLEGFRSCCLGCGITLGVGILLWTIGVFRAGDAKLYVALGGLMGGRWIFNCFLWSMLLAGFTGALFLLRRGILIRRLRRVWEYGKSILFSRRFFPYQVEPGSEKEFPLGFSIALGGFLTCFFPLW